MVLFAFALLLTASLVGYVFNRRAAVAIRADGTRLHSLPYFHGLYAALMVLVPVLVLILVWLALRGPTIDMMVMSSLPADATAGMGPGDRQLLSSEIVSIARGQIFGEPEPWKLAAAERMVSLQNAAGWLLLLVVAALGIAMLALTRRRVAAEFRARQGAEGIIHGIMIACSVFAILVTVGIIFSLLFEAIRFFRMVPFTEFLFGTSWEPQIPIRADQIAAEGAFGWLPVLTGTLVISFIAMFFSIPIGLFSAIYLNEFASQRVRKTIKPILEILAGIPTVVYGFFATLTVAPFLRDTGAAIGLQVSPNTALAAGSVMAVMLIPFISSFTDDALSAVPRSLRDGSLALGSTRSETMLKVLFPAAIPGIVGGILLAVSRAIGETMIVVMAAGIMANLTLHPLDSVTTITVQIMTLLIGDTSFDSPKTLAAFALGLMLFIFTLLINILALRIVRKYRELYD
ncbi:phosphate ABC transporter permease subunit PstC [Paracoccus sediminicola]|uniref:phosphate ABC transporter permease subunit PstC n=1 Tax=Paracoccus sediminicola TaxID=3017783 RepID=UPI0022F03195|nr:phosphate ABC transporter permease subunit PstC [Paracoccus sediminicola]WBU57385.1 phosphate ABC transporter permease subunit PstC [Paracoccus sediminicola]